MSQILTCEGCEHQFAADSATSEIQCPRCGQLQDAPVISREVSAPQPKETRVVGGSLQDLEFSSSIREVTEASAPSASVISVAEAELSPSIMEEPTRPKKEVAPDEAPLSPNDKLARRPVAYLPPNIWQTLGPTLLVCCLFLAWVCYDKLLRKTPPTPGPDKLRQELNNLAENNPDSYLTPELKRILKNSQE